MRQLSRSVVVLVMGFAGTVAITLGMVMLIVQDRAAVTADATPTPFPTIAPDAAPTATGGSLVVSGDREGTFTLDRDSYAVAIDPDFERGFARVEFGRFGLLGGAGAVYFSPDPLVVEQIDFDGMAFYPEPEDCAITPGELNPTIGVASAHVTCADLTDIRDAGIVTVQGGIALPGDLLGLRGDLPPSGGEMAVGSQTLAFSDGRVLVQNALTEDTERQPLFLYGDDDASSIGFERDPDTAELFVTYLVVDEELFDIPDEACRVTTTELGMLNPITTVLELSIQCAELDLGAHGVVAIDDSLVIDLILEAESVAGS